MAVVIVHGTHDPEGQWWMETSLGSFAASIDQGLYEAGSQPQTWRIGDFHVSAFKELRPKATWSVWSGRTAPPFGNREGRFRWSGADLHGAGRLAGGVELARYLERLSSIAPDEPIHIVAHSHGCNVVKHATQMFEEPVHLGRIIFLACPHFVAVQTQDLPYRINPSVMGRYRMPVLNFYSPQDEVQTTVAALLPDLGMAPGVPEIKLLGFPGTPIVTAHRSDQDEGARNLYEEFAVNYRGGVGTAAHGAVHNPSVGRFLGYWIGQSEDLSAHRVWAAMGLGMLNDE